LLLFELGLSFNVLLLEFGNKIVSEFDLVPGVEIFGLCSGGLEGVSVPLFFEGDNFPVELLYFLFLPKQFILFLLQKLLSVGDLFVDLAVAGFRPLQLLLVHIAVSLQLVNERLVPPLTLLLFVQLVLQLGQSLVDAVFHRLQFNASQVNF
jgi:hypothetical protein